MKKLKKQFVAAIALCLIAVLALGTSTFAWFAMNANVSATGMQVKAEAEGGIVISNEDKITWSASAEASHAGPASLVPTSTDNVTNWYHNTSQNAADAAAGQEAGKYTELGVTEDTTNKGVYTATIGTQTKGVYLLNKFYIKSSAAEAMTVEGGLLINQVTVEGAQNSPALDASLRVAIKIGGQVYIFAPVTGATKSYTVAGSGTTTTAKTTEKDVATTVTSIPGNATTTPTEAQVYIYFEGEDTNCKSNNITATLDNLSVSVQFGTKPISTETV